MALRAWAWHRHFLLTSFVAFTAVVLAVLVLSAELFVWPSKDAPQHSDAIVVLGGSGPRIQKGLALAQAGYAPDLAISNAGLHSCPKPPHAVKVICFMPVPLTTQGEARAVAQLAATHHWRQIIVVSGIPQTTRARIRFDRCYKGVLLFVPVPPGNFGAWLHNVVYEWGALTKALLLQRSC